MVEDTLSTVSGPASMKPAAPRAHRAPFPPNACGLGDDGFTSCGHPHGGQGRWRRDARERKWRTWGSLAPTRATSAQPSLDILLSMLSNWHLHRP